MPKKIVLSVLFAFSLIIVSKAQLVLDGLSAHYPLNGNANDMSNNALNGTVDGAIMSEDRFGNPRGAFYLDGINDIIVCDTSKRGIDDTLAISAWIKTADSKEQWIIGKYDWKVDAGFHMLLLDGVPRLNGRDRNDEYIRCIGTEAIDDNEWHHLVGMIKSNVWELWVDGNKVKLTENNHISVNISNSLPLDLGRYYYGDQMGDHKYFHGSIDDIRLYNKVLTEVQIEQLFLEGKCKETIYDTLEIIDTVQVEIYDSIEVYDTLKVFDTIPVYDSITVMDTLIIEASTTHTGSTNMSLVKIYPNPTQDQIHVFIENPETMFNYTLSIYNLIGETIYINSIDKQLMEIPLSDFTSPGVYLLVIRDHENNPVETLKILLK